MPRPQIRPYPKNSINSLFAISMHNPEDFPVPPPKANSPRKKRINPMIIEAVLQTIQASEEPLRVEHICQKNRWINGIGSIQSAAKILEGQGLIKVTRYCGYSVY